MYALLWEVRPIYITRSRRPEQGTTFQPLVFTNRSLSVTPLKYYSRDILDSVDIVGTSLKHEAWHIEEIKDKSDEQRS